MSTLTPKRPGRSYSRAEKSILLWRKSHARPKQIAPLGDWRVWFIMSGRGFGKTRSAAEYVKEKGLTHPNSRIAVGAPTFEDARDICFEGESGLLNVLPADSIKSWNRSTGELFLVNRTKYKVVRADVKRTGRGPQWNYLWGDEIAEWRYPDTWNQLMLGLRLGEDPRGVATGTPKPVQLVRDLVKGEDTHVTGGSTYENAANLAAAMFREITQKYEGTAQGQQEIYGKLLSEMPGALWQRTLIEAHRHSVRDAPAFEDLEKVVCAIDPQISKSGGDSETGIVLAGSIKDHAWVYSDVSGDYSPNGWAKAAADALEAAEGDFVVAEINQGGDLVKQNMKGVAPSLPVRYVHAKRGKVLRADGVVGAYEQGRVHHVGMLSTLEDQMCSFTRDEQPLGTDRVDALVYALMFLLLKGSDRKAMVGVF